MAKRVITGYIRKDHTLIRNLLDQTHVCLSIYREKKQETDIKVKAVFDRYNVTIKEIKK